MDAFLQKNLLNNLSRSQIAKLIANGSVKCNGVIVTKALYKIKAGETISVDMTDSGIGIPAQNISSGKIDDTEDSSFATRIEPENIPLHVLYEDDDIIVLGKPNGMVVHPSGNRNRSGTLVNALLFHYGLERLSNCGIEEKHFRPGIVHRLDKNTTGIMVVAKNNDAHKFLQEQFANKNDENSQLNRSYIALVHNHLKLQRQTLDFYLGRHKTIPQKRIVVNQNAAFLGDSPPANLKRAITHCKVIETITIGKEKFTLVELKLATGRTHQIRASMAHIEHPVVGDTLYNFALKKRNVKKRNGSNTPILNPFQKEFENGEQLLHAKTLGFIHPKTQQYMQFEAKLPPLFTKVLEELKNKERSGDS